MEIELFSLLSVVFFCGCCHQFIRSVLSPIPILATERKYARQALQLSKYYKSMAWGLMALVFFVGLVTSFQHIFQQI